MIMQMTYKKRHKNEQAPLALEVLPLHLRALRGRRGPCICMCMCVYMYIYIYIHVLYVCVCVCVYIYIYIYVYIHMYILYLCAYICSVVQSNATIISYDKREPNII